MADIRLNESERKCLKLLVDACDDPEACILFYSHITKATKLTLIQARRAVRSLARKGLAEHKVAWDTLDGVVHGSGYMATFAGQKFAQTS